MEHLEQRDVPATLNPGDIVFTGLNINATPERASFVLLRDLSAETATQVFLTDNAWTGSALNTNEGTISFTLAANTFAAGSRFYLNVGTGVFNFDGSSTGITYATAGGTIAFANGGDNLLAYQGTAGSPTGFVAAIQTGAFVASAPGNGNTVIPTGLTNGTDAIDVGAASNNVVLSSADPDIGTTVTGSPSAIRALTQNDTNWLGAAAAQTVPPAITFSVSGGSPTVSVSPTTANQAEGNSGSTPFTFTVTRTGTGTQSVDWGVTGSGSDPADPADFAGGVLPTGTVNFTGTTTSEVVTINVNGDVTSEPNEGFTVTLSNPTGGLVLGGATAAGTIQNDDGFADPTSPTGDVAFIGYNTGGTPDSFTVVLMRDLPAGTTFFASDNEVTTAGGTTFADLNEGEAQFTASANLARGTVITLPWGAAAVGNDLYTWSSTTGVGLGGSNESVYLYTAPSITSTTPTAFIAHLQVGAGDGGVRPSGLATGFTSVTTTGAAGRYKTTGATDTGTLNPLLAAIGNTAATWEAVAPVSPGDWTFSVTDAALADAVVALSTVTYQQVEGNTGSANAVITLTRIGNLGSSVSVDFATSPGVTNPATAGTDYTTVSQTVTFAANQTVATVNVPVVGDTDLEPTETIGITLSAPTVVTGSGTASLGTTAATVLSILDDDGAAPAPGALLLNEVYFNPPGADAGNEFVEIRNTTASPVSLNGVYYVAVEGDDAAATAGTADRVIDLTGQTVPANGIFVIKSSLSNLNFGSATVLNTAAFDADAIENGANTHFLVFSPTPVVQGTDYDATNDGTLDAGSALATATVLDSIGYREDASGELNYGPAIPRFANVAPDSISRFATNNTAGSAGAWFGGALVSALPLTYAETLALDGLPLGAVVTPGEANFATPAAGEVRFAASGFTGNEGGNITVTLTRTGGSTGAVSAVVTAGELSSAFPGTESFRAGSGTDFAASPAAELNNLLTWSGGVVTVNTANPHGLAVGDGVAVAGALPAGYNGGFVVASVTSATGYTYALATNPGAAQANGSSQKGTLVSWAAGDAAPKSFTLAVPQDTDAEGNEAFDLRIAGVSGGAVTTIRTAAGVVNADDLQTAAPVVYINEVKVDTAGSDGPFEYIELRGAPNQVLTNVSVVSVEGDGQTAAVNSATWAGGTATLTVTDSIGIAVNDPVVVAGVLSAGPGSFNGTFTVTAVTATTVSYALATDPGAYITSTGDTVTGPPAAKPGTFDRVFDLTGQSLGSNGLLVIRGASGHAPVDPATTVVTDTRLDESAGVLENGTVSHLVVYSPTALTQATTPSGGAYELASDYDQDNNGSLEQLPAGAVLLDGIGWSDGGTGDIAYGTFLTSGVTAFSPNGAATRVLESTTPFSVNGFRQGDVLFTTSAELAYDFANANAPAGGVLTPGGANFSQTANANGTLSFTAAAVNTTEGASVVLTVQRVGGSSGVVTVPYTLADLGGTTAADYGTPTPASPLTWADGDSAPKTITIPVVDDTGAEGAEQFTVTLGAPTGGAGVGSPGVATVTIGASDNPTPVVVLNEILVNPTGTDDNREYVEIRSQSPGASLAGVWLLEIEGDASTARGTVDMAVDLSALTTGTANLLTLGTNYATSNPYGIVAGGTTLANLVRSPATMENGAVTFLLVTNFSGAVGTDYDADNNGVLDSTPWGVVIDGIGWVDGGTAGSVVYAGAPVIPMTPATSTQDAATRFASNQTPSTLAAWYAGEILDDANAATVDVTYDGAIAGSGNIPSGAVLTPGAANADTTPPTVTITDDVGGGPVTAGAAVTYTLQFSEAVTGVEAGDLGLTPGSTATGTFGSFTAVDADTYTVVFTTTGAGTLTAQVNNAGAVIEDLAGNDLATPAVDNTTVTVNAAANNGTFQFSSPTYTTNEGVGTFSATVTRTGGSVGTVTVPFTVTAGTATAGAGNDYVVLSATPITFSPGQTSQVVSFTVVDDGSNEATQDFSVTLGAPSLGSLGTTAAATVSITDPLLVVASLTATDSGVRVLFNRAVDTTTLNLYDNAAGALGAADVTVVGGTAGAQRGSLLVTPAAQVAGGQADREVYFLRTGGGLAADAYTVAVRSAADGLKDRAGVLLDGDANGTAGGAFGGTVTVATPAQPLIAALGDLTRGPTQALGIATVAAGLPLTLSGTTVNGNPITAFDIRVAYDPALFTPTDFIPTVSGYSGAFNANYATLPDGRRVMAIAVASATALPGSGAIQLGYFTGTVPAAAPYASKQVLTIIDADTPAATGGVNGGPLGQIVPASTVFDNATTLDVPVRGDDAVHLLAYFADTNGSQTITGGDASLVNQLAVGQGTGFPAYQNADPMLIADTNGSNTVTGGDASLINQKAVGLAVAQIPNAGPAGSTVGGPDPRLSIGNVTGAAGGTFTVSVDFLATETITPGLSSVQAAISWNPNVFTYVGTAQLGAYLSSLPGWSFGAQNIDNAVGVARMVFNTSNPEATTVINSGGVAFTFQLQVSAAATPANYPINLRQSYTGSNGITTETLAENNDGALTLIPAPTDGPNDAVDGTFAVTAAATPTGTVFIPNQNAAAGASFTVPLNVQFNNATTPGFASLQYAITWDPTKLSVTGTPTLGAYLAGLPGWSLGAFNLDNVNGTLRIVANTSNPSDVSAGTVGTAFNIPFTAAPTASGSTYIDIAQNVGGTTDTLVEYENGVTVLPLVPAPTDATNQPGVDAVVTITVSPNQPPFNAVPAAQTYLTRPGAGGTNLVFSTATGNAIQVSDADAGSANLQVTLSVLNGTLALNGTTGLTVTGNATGTVVATGSLANLNAALDGLTFTPTAGFYGTTAITVNTNDLGNSGFGGATYDLDSVAVTPVGLFISEVLFQDSGSQTSTTYGTLATANRADEYIEIFSTLPGYELPADLYFVGIEGDSGAAGNPGNVQDVFPLGGLTTGANGYLILTQRTNPYNSSVGVNANATLLANTGTGNGWGNGATSNIGGRQHLGANRSGELVTDMENGSVSYLLVQAPTAPATANDIDANDDGTPDGAVFAGWTVLDGVGTLDGSAAADRSYGRITFRNGAAATAGQAPTSLTVVQTAFNPTYVGRVAAFKGWQAGDWVASALANAGSATYDLGSNVSNPAYASRPLNQGERLSCR